MILKNEDGTNLNRDQFYDFLDCVLEQYDQLIIDNPRDADIQIKQEAVREAFMQLHNSHKDDDTLMKRALKRYKQKRYAANKREKKRALSDTQIGDTHWEKIMKGYVRNIYRSTIFSTEIKGRFIYKNILFTIFDKMNKNKADNKTESYYNHRENFVFKNKDFIQKVIKQHVNKLSEFRNTDAFIYFNYKFTNGFYKNKIDIEHLTKYLSFSNRINSNTSDLKFISDIIYLCFKRSMQPKTLEYYLKLEEEQQEEEEILNENDNLLKSNKNDVK